MQGQRVGVNFCEVATGLPVYAQIDVDEYGDVKPTMGPWRAGRAKFLQNKRHYEFRMRNARLARKAIGNNTELMRLAQNALDEADEDRLADMVEEYKIEEEEDIESEENSCSDGGSRACTSPGTSAWRCAALGTLLGVASTVGTEPRWPPMRVFSL